MNRKMKPTGEVFATALRHSKAGIVSFAQGHYSLAAQQFTEGLSCIKPNLLSDRKTFEGYRFDGELFFHPLETKIRFGPVSSPIDLKIQEGQGYPIRHLAFACLYNVGLSHQMAGFARGLHPYPALERLHKAFALYHYAEALAVEEEISLPPIVEMSIIYNRAKIYERHGDSEKFKGTMETLLTYVLAIDESVVSSEDLDFFYSTTIIHFTGMKRISAPAA